MGGHLTLVVYPLPSLRSTTPKRYTSTELLTYSSLLRLFRFDLGIRTCCGHSARHYRLQFFVVFVSFLIAPSLGLSYLSQYSGL